MTSLSQHKHPINKEVLHAICASHYSEFARLGTPIGTGANRHIHIDRGSNVLAVAHLDTVQTFKGLSSSHSVVQCSTLDNRLGAYIALSLLPDMGIIPDVLLTDYEEQGRSTGEFFNPTKDYNWMFSFDRGGHDVVLYQYEDEETVLRLENAGAIVGSGTYSDVSSMEHLGIKGFNFGCGMHNYHSQAAYCDLYELDAMMDVFQRFWHKNHTVPMPHEYNANHNYGQWWWNDMDDIYLRHNLHDGYWDDDSCDLCGEKATNGKWVEDEELFLCRWCMDEFVNDQILEEVS